MRKTFFWKKDRLYTRPWALGTLGPWDLGDLGPWGLGDPEFANLAPEFAKLGPEFANWNASNRAEQTLGSHAREQDEGSLHKLPQMKLE